MKSGAGDDPFADEEDEIDSATEDVEPAVEATAETDDVDPLVEGQEATDATGSRGSDSDTSATDDPEIPWVLRRSKVKEDRDEVRQFFLRDYVADGERDLRNTVEDRLGKDVRKLDLREAAYIVAQRHPEEVARELERWGYEYL